MTDLKNPIQMGIVDRGKFIFPISSYPKGEGVGKINFPLFVPDFLFDMWDGTLQNFDDFLCQTWNRTLRKHYEFISDWWSQEDGDIIIKIFKKDVGQFLFSIGVNYWFPEIYSIFCSFVRMRRLDKLKCRDMKYFSSLQSFDPKRWFSDEVLRTRGPVFNRSRILATIDRIDGAISKKIMEPIVIDYKMSSLLFIVPESLPVVDPILEMARVIYHLFQTLWLNLLQFLFMNVLLPEKKRFALRFPFS
jgi:hypothetical protein